MKTITEFSGFLIRDIYALKSEVVRKYKEEQSKAKPAEPALVAEPVAEPEAAPAGEAAPETVETKSEAETPTEVVASDVPTPPKKFVIKPLATPIPVAAKPARLNRFEQAQKLKAEREKRQAEWKVLEEQTRADFEKGLVEKFKFEGEKLAFIMNSVRSLDHRRVRDLKRVVVVALSEGEKAPDGAYKEGDHYFLPEYLAPLADPRRNKRGRFGKGKKVGGRGGRGDKKFGKGGGRGRGDRQDRDNQGGRGEGRRDNRNARNDRNPPRGPRPSAN